MSQYFSNEFRFENSIYTLGKSTTVSFPEDGYERCFALEDDSFWFKHRNKCISLAVTCYSKDAVLFDVGGGNGKVAKYLQDQNIPVVLIEAGLEGAINARQRGVRNLVHADFTDLDIKPSSLPAVGMFDVLEHIDDDVAAIKNIYNSLMPGGYYYLTVPAYQFLWSKEDIDAGHFRRYALRSLKQKLRQAGFTISYGTYFFQYLPLPILLTRVLSYRLQFLKKRTADDAKNEHTSDVGKSKILDLLNNRELLKIGKSKRMNFGGSILIVAKKS